MSQASYLNGYDDGYEDAMKELAKQDGSGGSGDGGTSDVRRPTVFTFGVSGHYEYEEGIFDEYVFLPVGNAVLLQSSDNGGMPHIQGPAGGFIAGDTIVVSGPGTHYLQYVLVDSRAAPLDLTNAESTRALVYFGPDNGWAAVEQPESQE